MHWQGLSWLRNWFRYDTYAVMDPSNSRIGNIRGEKSSIMLQCEGEYSIGLLLNTPLGVSQSSRLNIDVISV